MRIKKKTMILLVLIYATGMTTYIWTRSPKEKIIEKPEASQTSSPYEEGYTKGYHAFLAQTGTYMPMPPIGRQRIASKYTTSIDEETVVDDQPVDEYSQGYVDGYHRATEALHCPRREDEQY